MGFVHSGEVHGSKNGAVNNEGVIADGNGVTEGQEDHCLKNETVNNVVANADEGNSGAVECFQTYKRRKHAKSSSEFKVQENSRKHMGAASQLLVQVFSTAFTTCVPVMVLYCYLSLCIRDFMCYVCLLVEFLEVQAARFLCLCRKEVNQLARCTCASNL